MLRKPKLQRWYSTSGCNLSGSVLSIGLFSSVLWGLLSGRATPSKGQTCPLLLIHIANYDPKFRRKLIGRWDLARGLPFPINTADCQVDERQGHTALNCVACRLYWPSLHLYIFRLVGAPEKLRFTPRWNGRSWRSVATHITVCNYCYKQANCYCSHRFRISSSQLGSCVFLTFFGWRCNGNLCGMFSNYLFVNAYFSPDERADPCLLKCSGHMLTLSHWHLFTWVDLPARYMSWYGGHVDVGLRDH